jgi:hypothetical protein
LENCGQWLCLGIYGWFDWLFGGLLGRKNMSDFKVSIGSGEELHFGCKIEKKKDKRVTVQGLQTVTVVYS